MLLKNDSIQISAKGLGFEPRLGFTLTFYSYVHFEETKIHFFKGNKLYAFSKRVTNVSKCKNSVTIAKVFKKDYTQKQ